MMGLGNRPSRADQVIAQDISGALVLLSIFSGLHYSLNELGGRVWALCDGTRTVAEIVEVLSQEYEAPADRIQDDVLALLRELSAERLVDGGDRAVAGG